MKLASDPQALLSRAPAGLLLTLTLRVVCLLVRRSVQRPPGADPVPAGKCREHQRDPSQDACQVQRAVDEDDRGDHQDRCPCSDDQRSLPVAEERDRVEHHDHHSGRGPGGVKRSRAENCAELDADQRPERRPRAPGQRGGRGERQNIPARRKATGCAQLPLDDQRGSGDRRERDVPEPEASSQHRLKTLLRGLATVIARANGARLMLAD